MAYIRWTRKDGTKISKVIHHKTLRGFTVGQTVTYKSKEYKIHSFPFDGREQKAHIMKYRKNGLMDSRATMTTVKLKDLNK